MIERLWSWLWLWLHNVVVMERLGRAGGDGMQAVLAAADRAAVQSVVDGGLAHCVHCLHGIDLPWRPPAPWANTPQARGAPVGRPAAGKARMTATMPFSPCCPHDLFPLC